MSESSSSPRRRPSRSRTAHAHSSASAAPLAPSARSASPADDRERHAARPAREEHQQRRPRPVPALEQPAEQEHGAEHRDLVAVLGVDEQRRRGAPPLVGDARAEREVVEEEQARVEEDRHDDRREDERDRRVRAPLAADARHLPRLQPPQRGPPARRLRRLRRPAALELRRALAQALAAVRAFGDVRRHLTPAAAADDKEVRAACHERQDTSPRRNGNQSVVAPTISLNSSDQSWFASYTTRWRAAPVPFSSRSRTPSSSFAPPRSWACSRSRS